MFRVKVCGITSVEDAAAAVDAGVEAIGLNFCPTSPRLVPVGIAAEIARHLGTAALKVGVFVNQDPQQISNLVERVGLDAVQLHGDEPPEHLAALTHVPLIRGFRCRNGDLQPVVAYLNRCRQLNVPLLAVLLDAFDPQSYGGTGRTIPWTDVGRQRSSLGGQKAILAGGLTPQNVAAAIELVRPDAVDTASGVETAPGRKDADQMKRFVAAALSAFGSPDASAR